MDLEQKLKEAEALVASVRKQIEESKELKPFNWENQDRFLIDGAGRVNGNFSSGGGDCLFYKKTEKQAKALAHRLKILSCINNLKEALGCDWEFTKDKINYCVYWGDSSRTWEVTDSYYTDRGEIHFKNAEDAKKVAKYLNKNYPNGWRLA